MKAPDASIIIPTYRRSEDVLRCLWSILRQDSDAFEVIVVDNACDDDLRKSVEVEPPNGVSIRYVAESHLGLHNARHRGAREAASDLLLFVDDDAVCSPGWVRAYRSAFAAHPEVVLAAGPSVALWDRQPPQWLAKIAEPSCFTPFSLLDRGDQFFAEKCGPGSGIFFGCNMAVRRAVLFQLGGFNIELIGSRCIGDGETGLHRKLQTHRGLVGWVPEARVDHRIAADRMSLAYLRRRAALQGAADAYSRYNGSIPPRRALVADSARHFVDSLHYLRRARGVARELSKEKIDNAMAASHGMSFAHFVLRLTYSSSLRASVSRTRWLSAAASAGT
jgi:glucosyl-dolichyl phosphate glucuronosyltransferase